MAAHTGAGLFLARHETVLRLMREMHGAARRGDWEHVSVLQAPYAEQVERLRAQGDGPLLTAHERALRLSLLRAIVAEDAAIRALLEPAVAEVRGRLDNGRRQQALVQTYGAAG